jgi:glutathione synthase
VGPVLRENGLILVGLDVVGGYLTEINVTSPTCVREIEAGSGIAICEQFFRAIDIC